VASFPEDFDVTASARSTARADTTWRSSISAPTVTSGAPFDIAAQTVASHIHAGSSQESPRRTST
jgi:hypothetical protein